MKYISLIAIYLTLSVCALATPDIPGRIIYKGNEYFLFTNPLDFLIEMNPNMEPKIKINDSTYNLPEYYVEYEIIENQLILKDIVNLDESYNKEAPSLLQNLFPNKKQVKADWFSGLLVLPYGKLINYVHMGFASTYENYKLLEINKGNLIKEMNMNSKEYEKLKEKQFAAYKKTEKYKKVIAIFKENEGNIKDGDLDPFLKILLTDYTTLILTE